MDIIGPWVDMQMTIWKKHGQVVMVVVAVLMVVKDKEKLPIIKMDLSGINAIVMG